MWLFLAGEVMIFGAMIFAFEIYYSEHQDSFKAASQHLHYYHGVVNTIVLLTSSYFVALGEAKSKRLLIILAAVLGCVFVGIKSHEYYSLIQEGRFMTHFTNISSGEKIFYIFYGSMTLLHAVHVLGGVTLLAIAAKTMNHNFIQNTALFWHFVDLVWVFLFPLFYLLGQH